MDSKKRKSAHISTTWSITQDMIPLWDLIKMSHENIVRRTWDGKKLHHMDLLVRWVVILVRFVSLAFKVIGVLDSVRLDVDRVALDAGVIVIAKAVGHILYTLDQLYLNRYAITKKFPKTVRFINTHLEGVRLDMAKQRKK